MDGCHNVRRPANGIGARHLDISAAHALRAQGLNWGHRDPFDRVLAAQALLEQATLVTADDALDEVIGSSPR
jgi:PIN domain nuclease of toxin-antitoxin system